MKQFKWPLLILAYISLFSMGVIDNSRGAAYPKILETFLLNGKTGSLLFTFASLAGLLVNITSRYWLGFIGAGRAATISLFLMFLGGFFIGQSPGLSHPLFWLYFFSFVFGIGASASGISMNVLVSKGAPLKYRRQAFAGLHSTYGIASFAAPFILTLILRNGFTWGHHFVFISMIPAFFFFIALFLNSKKRIVPHEKTKLTPPIPYRERLQYGILFGAYVASEIVISSRLVLFAEKSRGLSFETAGKMLSTYFFFLMLGRLLFAFIPFKGSAEKLLLFSLISTFTLYLIGFFVNPWAFALTAFPMSYFFPVGMAWLSELFHEGMDFMTGTIMTSTGFSLIIVHQLFGMISDILSIEWAMGLAPVCTIISLLFLILIRRKHVITTKKD